MIDFNTVPSKTLYETYLLQRDGYSCGAIADFFTSTMLDTPFFEHFHATTKNGMVCKNLQQHLESKDLFLDFKEKHDNVSNISFNFNKLLENDIVLLISFAGHNSDGIGHISVATSFDNDGFTLLFGKKEKYKFTDVKGFYVTFVSKNDDIKDFIQWKK